MTIAVYHNLQSGGAKKAIFEVVAALQRRGHRIDVYQPDTANSNFYDLTSVATTVTVLPTRPHHWMRIFGALLEERRTAKLAAAMIEAKKYDGVIVTNSSLVQHPYIMRYLKQPFVLITQEYLRMYYERRERRAIDRQSPHPSTRMKALVDGLYAKFIASIDRTNLKRGHKKIIVNSKFAGQCFERAYHVPNEVYYCGVADEFKPNTVVQRTNTVVSIGALDPFKGHDFIIRSLAHVPPAIRPTLIVVADRTRQPEYAEFLEKLAHEKGVPIELQRNVSQAAIVSLLQQAKVTLCGNILEPFGLVPIESMACGTPVIAVREGGLQETVVDGVTGILTDRDQEHFGAAITKLLTDDAERERLGKNGPTYVAKKFSWASYAKKLEQDFNELRHA